MNNVLSSKQDFIELVKAKLNECSDKGEKLFCTISFNRIRSYCPNCKYENSNPHRYPNAVCKRCNSTISFSYIVDKCIVTAIDGEYLYYCDTGKLKKNFSKGKFTGTEYVDKKCRIDSLQSMTIPNEETKELDTYFILFRKDEKDAGQGKPAPKDSDMHESYYMIDNEDFLFVKKKRNKDIEFHYQNGKLVGWEPVF